MVLTKQFRYAPIKETSELKPAWIELFGSKKQTEKRQL